MAVVLQRLVANAGVGLPRAPGLLVYEERLVLGRDGGLAKLLLAGVDVLGHHRESPLHQ